MEGALPPPSARRLLIERRNRKNRTRRFITLALFTTLVGLIGVLPQNQRRWSSKSDVETTLGTKVQTRGAIANRVPHTLHHEGSTRNIRHPNMFKEGGGGSARRTVRTAVWPEEFLPEDELGGGAGLDFSKLQEVQSVAAVSAAWMAHVQELQEEDEESQIEKEAPLLPLFPPSWKEWLRLAKEKESTMKKIELIRTLLRATEKNEGQRSQHQRLQRELKELEGANTILTMIKRSNKKQRQQYGRQQGRSTNPSSSSAWSSSPSSPLSSLLDSAAGPWIRGWWVSKGSDKIKPHLLQISTGLNSFEARSFTVDQITRKFGKLLGSSSVNIIEGEDGDGGIMGGGGWYGNDENDDNVFRALTNAPAVPFMGKIDIGPIDLSVLSYEGLEDPLLENMMSSAYDDDDDEEEEEDHQQQRDGDMQVIEAAGSKGSLSASPPADSGSDSRIGGGGTLQSSLAAASKTSSRPPSLPRSLEGLKLLEDPRWTHRF